MCNYTFWGQCAGGGGGGFMPKDGFDIVESSPSCCSMGQFADWGL